jgi:multicomponent Na+:H+ antiporter subunit D
LLHFDTATSWLPPAAVAASILGSAVLLAAGRFLPRLAVDLISTSVAAAGTVLAAVVTAASASGRVVTWMGGWAPVHGVSVGIALVTDPVGGGIALLAGVLTTLALLYSWRYFEQVEAHYHALLLMFLAGMQGLAFSGDLFDLFVFFELMGAAAYALTGMKVEDGTAVQGALNFGLINSLAAYFSFAGVGLLYARTGDLGLPDLGDALAHHRPDALVVAAFVMVLSGFLVKAALVPFHFWLADAHAVAPAPACALFSGVMVTLGAYACFRTYWTVFSGTLSGPDVRRMFLVVGVVTAVVGTIMCPAQHHTKRMLAFSTIAHVGLIVCALALLTPGGTAGAFLFAAGHAGAQAALFFLAGLLLNRYGSVDERDLYGRGRGARVVPWLWVAGALALADLPPFGTSLGAAVSLQAGLGSGYDYLAALFVLVPAVTGGTALRVTGRVFFALGPPPPRHGDVDVFEDDEDPDIALRRVPVTMLVPIVVTLAGCLAEGLVPGAGGMAAHAGAYFVDRKGYSDAALRHLFSPVAGGHPAAWTFLGVGLGVVSAVAACAVAALGLWSLDVSFRFSAVTQACRRALGALRRIHSGHIGDYVAWLMTGMAVVAALIGLPLMR